MRSAILQSVLTAMALTVVIGFTGPVKAEVVNLKTTLNAKNEVPPNSSQGTGTVTATYDTAGKKLSWKGSYSGLTGPATAAHFHSGGTGKNGTVVVPIVPNTRPFEGSATLTGAQAAELLAGTWYVNVHSDANTRGEIPG